MGEDGKRRARVCRLEQTRTWAVLYLFLRAIGFFLVSFFLVSFVPTSCMMEPSFGEEKTVLYWAFFVRVVFVSCCVDASVSVFLVLSFLLDME